MDTKKLQRIIYAGLLGSALVLNGVASAAVVTNRVPLLGYAEHNITVYRAPGGMKAAVVAAEAALIQITQVRADGWAYGTYPMSNGRRAGGWFRMSDVQSNVNYSNANGKIVMQQTVYRTPSMSGSNGVVVVGENVLVIAEQDGFSQIIYKQKNSANWRIGWVLSSAIQKELVAVPMNRSQNSASLQKTTPITSNVKVSSKQTANDSVQKVQPTVQKTTMQTTSASTSVKSAVQKSTKPSTMAKTNTATKTVSTTAGKQNIQLTNNRNAGLQLGKARNQIINRYGQALRQSHIFNNAELTNRKGIALNAGASFVVLEEAGVAYKITYSAQNQLQEGWVNRNDISLLNVLYKIWQGTMNQRAQAFYNIELTQRSNQIEFAEKGDKVTILNEKGNAYFISYPLTNGSYKARWVVQNTVSGTNPNRIVVPVTRQNTVLKGDMNQDGKVDQADLEILTRVRVGKEPLTDYYRKAGDMNGDGKIDIIDMANLSDAITKGAKAGMDAALKFKPEIAKRRVDVYTDPAFKIPGYKMYIDKGESYSVIGQNGNALEVKYKSDKGEDRQGWVPSSIREEILIPAKLQSLMNIWENHTWKNHSYIKSNNGPKECKEFASYIFDQLHSVGYIGGGSTSSNINNHTINLSNPDKVEMRNSSKNLTVDIVRNLFKNAQPGDFVQMRRKSGSPHSAILASVDDKGVQFFEANVGSYNIIQVKFYTYDQLVNGINGYYQNVAMSVYYAK